MAPFREAFVTGASSGLGRAIAVELARRGAFVHLLARRADELEHAVDALCIAGGDGVAVPGDVTDPDLVARAVAAADERSPDGLDLVVAGAGVAESGLEEDDRVERARALLDVNLSGAISTIEAGVRAMESRGRGTIACVTSLAGTRGMPGSAPYSASKAGLSTYVESRRIDLAGSGLRLVDVQPGFVRTPLTDRNRFRMPFMMDAEDAARRTVDGLERGRDVVHYPRRLAWPLKLVARTAPGPLWRALVRRR